MGEEKKEVREEEKLGPGPQGGEGVNRPAQVDHGVLVGLCLEDEVDLW